MYYICVCMCIKTYIYIYMYTHITTHPTLLDFASGSDGGADEPT